MRWNCWKTKPIVVARKRARFSGEGLRFRQFPHYQQGLCVGGHRGGQFRVRLAMNSASGGQGITQMGNSQIKHTQFEVSLSNSSKYVGLKSRLIGQLGCYLPRRLLQAIVVLGVD